MPRSPYHITLPGGMQLSTYEMAYETFYRLYSLTCENYGQVSKALGIFQIFFARLFWNTMFSSSNLTLFLCPIFIREEATARASLGCALLFSLIFLLILWWFFKRSKHFFLLCTCLCVNFLALFYVLLHCA